MYLTKQSTEIKNLDINCSGCSETEIEAKESEQNLIFPKAFKEFLMICGKDHGHLFCGDNITLSKFNYINECGKGNFKDALGKEPKDALVFILEHHGYSFYYFELGTGENPDLHLLVNGDEVFHQKFGKFADLLNQGMKNCRTY
ncbi:MAG: hypothetical protein ACI8ZM_004523 [Crocinitomix sp.]|jgi:hypothetical protein